MDTSRNHESVSDIPPQGDEELQLDEVLPKRRRFKRTKALGSAAVHAYPDEVRGLRATFRQAREDMANVRAMVGEVDSTTGEVKVTRRDVFRYMLWRYGSMAGYQLTDDIYSLPIFMLLQEKYGTEVAYFLVATGATAQAGVVGMVERHEQKWKAEAQGLEVVGYEGEMTHHMLDASVNSAPWNVMTRASADRDEGSPVQLMTPAKVLAMSSAYALVNTLFYAGATSIPFLNSWSAFMASLGVMFGAKGTIRGYQERMALPEADTPTIGTEEESEVQ